MGKKQNKSQRWEKTKWPSHRQEALHSGPPGLQPVHEGGDAQRPWVKGLRIHQGNFLPWIGLITIIQWKLTILLFADSCWNPFFLVGSCWRLQSRVERCSPAGPQPLYFSTNLGQRETNRPKLKTFFSSCRSTATLFLNLYRPKKDKQTKAQKFFLPRAAARTLLKLFFRRRAHEKERGFWSWPTALMGGGWLGFVRCYFEEKMEGCFAQVAGIPCDLRLSPETRPVGEDEVRR